MQSETAVTLRGLVSVNMARLRQAAGAPVERLVNAAGAYGLTWTKSWLQAVENGNRSLTGEQLLMLPIVLSSALSQRITLADLLTGDQPVALSPQEPVTASHLRDVVTGVPSLRPFAAPDTTALLMAANLEAVEKMRTVREANLGDIDVRTLSVAEAGAGQAEEKLARKLGVPVIVVIAASASLWGHSMTDERDARCKDQADTAGVTRRLAAAVGARITEAAEAAKGCAEPAAASA